MSYMVGIDLARVADEATELLKIALSAYFGWGIPRWYRRYSRARQLRLAGVVFPAIPRGSADPVIHIRASLDEVPFGKNPQTIRGYTHSGEMLAVMHIVTFFEKLPVRIEFDYYPEITYGMKNVVILGASERSDISSDLRKELFTRGIMVPGKDAHAHFKDALGNTYGCSHVGIEGRSGEKLIVAKDAGIIFRKVTQIGGIILLCAGVHQFGTLAATEVALSTEFQQKVRKKRYRQFVQFVTVDTVVSGNRAGLGINGPSIRWRDLPLQAID